MAKGGRGHRPFGVVNRVVPYKDVAYRGHSLGKSYWEYALEVIIEMIVLPCIHDIL
jgi:hypothetical protein